MSKSLGNYIGITESADEVYGKTMSVSDVLMFRYYELLSDRNADEIATLKNDMASGKTHPKWVKQLLARELASRFHGSEAADKAEENFEKVFSQHDLPDDIPEMSLSVPEKTIWLPKLLAETGMVKGTGEAKRLIQQNAVTVNGEKIDDVDHQVNVAGVALLKVGKRRFCRVIFTP
jgi:tyrosyl-tRNA synthetase